MEKADTIINQLGLIPHPEGGHYREIYRHLTADGIRGDATTIYFLLSKGEISRWHKIDAIEIWHYYAGASLTLDVAENCSAPTSNVLGIGLDDGERPVAVVPKQAWQSARSNGDWTLVGCTVAPAFEFSGFEMAPQGWIPEGFGPVSPETV